MIYILSIIFSACDRKSHIDQDKHDGLMVQVIKMPAEANDGGIINFSTRLIPDKNTMADLNQNLRTGLSYRMDSCFYLLNGTHKTYPNIVQPIANGVSSDFGYLLSFDAVDLKKAKWQLTYQDKYLNHKIYHIVLNKD